MSKGKHTAANIFFLYPMHNISPIDYPQKRSVGTNRTFPHTSLDPHTFVFVSDNRLSIVHAKNYELELWVI